MYQLHLRVFGAAAIVLQTEQGALRRVLNLHQPHPCVFLHVQLRPHQQLVLGAQGLKNRDGLSLRRVDVHPLFAASPVAGKVQTDGLSGGGDLLGA